MSKSQILLCCVAIFVIANNALAQQECLNPSIKSDKVSVGANEVVYFGKVQKVGKIFGKVVDMNGDAIPSSIIDVFATKHSNNTSFPSGITDVDPKESYKVNARGEFCLSDLSDGDYVLRIGTDKFAFKHLVLKIRIRKSGSLKPLVAALDVGT